MAPTDRGVERESIGVLHPGVPHLWIVDVTDPAVDALADRGLCSDAELARAKAVRIAEGGRSLLARRAAQLAEDHALRGYDAVHLAAAEASSDESLVVVSADLDFCAAASALGLSVADLS